MTTRQQREPRMLYKAIVYFGQKVTLACDGRCDKAWGANGRPARYYMEDGPCEPRELGKHEEPRDLDDYVWLRDSELGLAPGPGETVGISEGGDIKPSRLPLRSGQQMNKWCARECERSDMFEPGKTVKVRDLEHPTPNIPTRRRA